MELHLFTEPQQGATYHDLLVTARAAERLGFAGFFRSDHYLHMTGDGGAGPTDAWTTLAGLARETESIRLGTLVSSATFRLPGPLAVQVAGVDRMSRGRVELGLGAGWYEREHEAWGIPFPSTRERFDRLEEQLTIIRGLWDTPAGRTFSHAGPHYPMVEAPGLAKPFHEGGVPIIVGGKGKRRTPDLAARFAAEFNVMGEGVDATRELFERVRRACKDHERDPETLRYSVALTICVGTSDAVVCRRARATGIPLDHLRRTGLVGTPDEVVGRLREYQQVGTSRIYLQILDLHDPEHLEEIAAGVMRPLS